MYSPDQIIRPDSTVKDVKKLFAATNYSSLPVLDNDDKLAGVVRIRDIVLLNENKQSILPYISQDYMKIQRPAADQDIVRMFYSNYQSSAEIYITDIDGRLVDVVNVFSFLKNMTQNSEIMNEDQFLKQILRPTSLARCILDGLKDAVIIVDKNNRILYANPAYSDILGININKIINHDINIIEPGAKILDVLDTGTPVVGKIINIKTLGILIMANITPINFHNNVVAAISVFTDITKITNIAAELEKMNIINKLLAQEMKFTFAIPDSFKGIIGTSMKLRKQLNLAAKIASFDSPVLILGESGTGKELLAKAIHDASPRRDGPFVSLNCAAIPDNLLESELFGYEEGAFTGAKKGGKIGKFQQANGGTLFLDEIGDMPLPMQTKLLRFLQDKELNKVGGVNPIKIDIRVISATNKNITDMIERKLFREDLFYRINVFTITLPPLRERRIDILNLIDYYKKYYEDRYKKEAMLSPECLQYLLNYHWPGNVRELKNAVEHCVVMSDGIITCESLPDYLKGMDNPSIIEKKDNTEIKPLVKKMKDLEKNAILDALTESNYNKSKAIELLGISRRTFYKKLKELNL